MRIIHISDLHISKDFKRQNIKKFKELLNYLTTISFDHIVITGDLSDNAQNQDYKIIRQILKNHDLLDSKKVSIIIGNHDIFGGVQSATDIIHFPRKCRVVDYELQVSNFITHFEELFTDCQFASSNKFFPYYKNLGEIGIIGINSIAHYSKVGNPIAATGKVYSDQLDDVQKIIKQYSTENQTRLALIHHHFYKKNLQATSPQNNIWNKIESYNLRLRNKKKVIKALKECGIKLVLHGHSHEVRRYDRKGVHFINAGGSIENEFNTICFFVIDIKNDFYEAKLIKVPSKTKFIHEQMLYHTV